MRWILGAATVAAGLCVFAGQASAQVSPCYPISNPPGAGIRYTCSSNSSHTIDHPKGTRLAANAWRTRITARRESGPNVFDVTVDSLSAPLADPVVQAVLADANLSVAGTGYAVASPALVSSSTLFVDTLPVSSVVTRTASVAKVSLSSSATLRVVCVGDLGDLAQAPPPLPEAPGCAPGA